MRKVRTALAAVTVASALIGSASTAEATRAATTLTYDNGAPGWWATGLPSQDMATPYDDLDREAADDVVVPKRTVWTINRIEVDAFVSPSPTGMRGDPSSFIITIYNAGSDASRPGAVRTETSGSTASVSYFDRGDYHGLRHYTIALNAPIQLPAGRYWLSVRARMDYLTQGQWTWMDNAPNTPKGSAPAWKKPAPDACSSWCVRSYDLVFRLTGTSSSA